MRSDLDAADSLERVLALPSRTICAECHWCHVTTGWHPTPPWYRCSHINGRDLVTGEEMHCRAKNDGQCRDYEPKQP